MRQYDEPIICQLENKTPVSFIWRRKKYQVVGIQETWVWAGHWWWEGKVKRRRYFRLDVTPDFGKAGSGPGRVCVVYYSDKKWMLESMVD